MKQFAFTSILLCSVAAASSAEFLAPQAYDATRYEPVWMKNPFTLKTAPVAVQKESFAKDLALSSVFGFGEDTTVNVVNTKTREFFRLKNKEPLQSNGMKVKSVNVRDSRTETFVEVELGSETAMLKYDEGFLKQMAANVAQLRTPVPGQPQPGVPGASPVQSVPVITGQQPKAPSIATARPPNFVPTPPVAASTSSGQPPGMPYVPSSPQRRQLTAPQPRTASTARPNP